MTDNFTRPPLHTHTCTHAPRPRIPRFRRNPTTTSHSTRRCRCWDTQGDCVFWFLAPYFEDKYDDVYQDDYAYNGTDGHNHTEVGGGNGAALMRSLTGRALRTFIGTSLGHSDNDEEDGNDGEEHDDEEHEEEENYVYEFMVVRGLTAGKRASSASTTLTSPTNPTLNPTDTTAPRRASCSRRSPRSWPLG